MHVVGSAPIEGHEPPGLWTRAREVFLQHRAERGVWGGAEGEHFLDHRRGILRQSVHATGPKGTDLAKEGIWWVVGIQMQAKVVDAII